MEEAEKVSKKLSVSFGIHNNWCYRKDRSVRKGGSGSEVYIGNSHTPTGDSVMEGRKCQDG